MRKVIALCGDNVVRTCRTNMNYDVDIPVSNAWTKVGTFSVAGWLVKTDEPFVVTVGSYDVVLNHVFESKGTNKDVLPSWDEVLKYEEEKAAPKESFS